MLITGKSPPDKYYTLPTRKSKKTEYSQLSIDRRARRNSEELRTSLDTPPKKPPRTFETYDKPPSNKKSSLFNIFKKSDKETSPKSKKRLKRSVSDATNLKSKVYGPANDEPLFRKRSGSQTDSSISNVKNNKKQLSPIIEITQREDYFAPREADKENIDYNSRYDDEDARFSFKNNENQKDPESVTEKLKEYIDEVDSALYEETGIKVNPSKQTPQAKPVVIDVDKAEKISNNRNSKSSKLISANALGKKLKSLTNKKRKISVKDKANVIKEKLTNKKKKQQDTIEEVVEYKPETIEIPTYTNNKVKEAVENLENQYKQNSTMIHSSQKPAEKLPLTRGRTVDTMVKRLSHDNGSPPPKSNIMITPNVSVQHNNNQPFSYTRGLSPEKSYSTPVNGESPTHPSSPVIYAQVVCGNGNKPNKQTVHTAYVNGKKHLPHSDSDEGLGYEENSGFNSRKYESDKTFTTRFEENESSKNDFSYNGTNNFEEEFPITPSFKTNGYSSVFKDYDKKFEEFLETECVEYVDSSSRGRGDGMDSKRRESLTESFDNGFSPPLKTNNVSTNLGGRGDLSARRDLLESRIHRKFGEKYLRQSPEYVPPANVYTTETRSKYYKSESRSPMGYNKNYTTETKINGSEEKYPNDPYIPKTYYRERLNGDDDAYKRKNYNYNGYESKNFETHLSDYRSSPENNRNFETIHYSKSSYKPEKRETLKHKEYHKSNPEIYHDSYENREGYQKTYHDSLRRERYENKYNASSKYQNERYLDQTEYDRKDKFGDSGIENDFRRDSGENFRVTRNVSSNHHHRREPSNDSEDEGFASSLLIASERQHTDDNFMNRKQKHDYDSDVSYRRSEKEDVYRHMENVEYKYPREYKTREYKNNEYAHRERSIDDGSHYDPRLDKNERGTLKKVGAKKPPKSEKKSSLEKVSSELHKFIRNNDR